MDDPVVVSLETSHGAMMTRTHTAGHSETYFASPLLSFGRSRVSPESGAWQETTLTPGESVLSFPLAPLVIRPLSGGAELLHPGVVALPPRQRAYQKQCIDDARGEETDWLWLSPVIVSWIEFMRPEWRDTQRWLLRLPPVLLLRQRRLMATARNVTACLPGPESWQPVDFEEAALDIIATLFKVSVPVAMGTSTARRRLALRTRQYLCDHLDQTLDLDAIGRHIGASVPHLCVAFKAVTGCTIGQYSRCLKLCYALGLIENQRYRDLTAVALCFGFSSHSHFSARFKETFGCTPREARRLLATD